MRCTSWAAILSFVLSFAPHREDSPGAVDAPPLDFGGFLRPCVVRSAMVVFFFLRQLYCLALAPSLTTTQSCQQQGGDLK